MSIVDARARGDRLVAFDQRAHRRDVAQADFGSRAVDRGDRAAHQALARLADALKPSASTVTRLASSRAASAFGRLAEDIALDLADAEFADQVEVVVGLDAFGGWCPCRGSRRA